MIPCWRLGWEEAIPELVDIPVVMLTVADNKSLGFALGASAYLSKPIDRDRLVSILKTMI